MKQILRDELVKEKSIKKMLNKEKQLKELGLNST